MGRKYTKQNSYRLCDCGAKIGSTSAVVFHNKKGHYVSIKRYFDGDDKNER